MTGFDLDHRLYGVGLEIDFFPAQPKGLAPPQSEREHRVKQWVHCIAKGGLEKDIHLEIGQCFADGILTALLVRLRGPNPDGVGRIDNDQVAVDGLVERRPEVLQGLGANVIRQPTFGEIGQHVLDLIAMQRLQSCGLQTLRDV